MAKFEFELVQEGYEGKSMTHTLSVRAVEPEEGETVLRFPEEVDGVPVEYVGYVTKFHEAYIEYGDWHHPVSHDDTYHPARYARKPVLLHLPETVEKIILPPRLRGIGFAYELARIPKELSPENPWYTVAEDGVTLEYKPKK